MVTDETVFAVFLLAGTLDDICATTRPDGSIGLPGGKVEPGESLEGALRREASEEGWTLPAWARLELVHQAMVHGRLVAWFATTARPTRSWGDHKEASRGIMPITVDESDLTGLGNPAAVRAWTAAKVRAANRDREIAPTAWSPRAPAPVAWCPPSPKPERKQLGRRCGVSGQWCSRCETDGRCEEFR